MSNTVGTYMSSKQWQKLNMDHVKQLLADHQINMVKIDLNQDLEKQGPFAIIIHKLSEDAAKAKQGDPSSVIKLQAFEVSFFSLLVFISHSHFLLRYLLLEHIFNLSFICLYYSL